MPRREFLLIEIDRAPRMLEYPMILLHPDDYTGHQRGESADLQLTCRGMSSSASEIWPAAIPSIVTRALGHLLQFLVHPAQPSVLKQRASIRQYSVTPGRSSNRQAPGRLIGRLSQYSVVTTMIQNDLISALNWTGGMQWQMLRNHASFRQALTATVSAAMTAGYFFAAKGLSRSPSAALRPRSRLALIQFFTVSV